MAGPAFLIVAGAPQRGRRIRLVPVAIEQTASVDRADLREAQEIAERGAMRLHEADAHLEWTRLHSATGDLAAARRHLNRARDLVHACGYGRRKREVTWLESRLSGEP